MSEERAVPVDEARTTSELTAELTSVRRLLRGTDPVPAARLAGAAQETAAQELCRDIRAGRRRPVLTADVRRGAQTGVGGGGPVRGVARRPVARRWVLAGAVVAGLTGVGVLLRAPGSGTAEALIPSVLPYSLPEGEPAGPALQRIAAAAALLPPLERAEYAYVRTDGWYLSVAAARGAVTSGLASTQEEVWRSLDGRGRSRQVSGPVLVDRVGSQETLDAVMGSPDGRGEGGQVFGEDGISPTPLVDVDALPWQDPQAWADTVHHHSGTGIPVPVDVITGIEVLFRDQPLDPADRARVWQLLASIPDVVDRGPITDRLGRDGRAFTVDGPRLTGGPSSQHLVIVDEATGQLLGVEEVHVGDPGALGMDLPAVASLTVLIAAAWVDSDTERGGLLAQGLVDGGDPS